MFKQKGVIFYIAFTTTIAAWYGFNTYAGTDMYSWVKASQGKEHKADLKPKHK